MNSLHNEMIALAEEMFSVKADDDLAQHRGRVSWTVYIRLKLMNSTRREIKGLYDLLSVHYEGFDSRAYLVWYVTDEILLQNEGIVEHYLSALKDLPIS